MSVPRSEAWARRMAGFVRLGNNVYALLRGKLTTQHICITCECHIYEIKFGKIDAKCMRRSNRRMDERRACLNSAQSSLV